MDRTFVLGSDELYREWGYTALSRHRQDARFYVTAGRTFINPTPRPLQPDEHAELRVARMLEASQAKQLAGEGIDRCEAAELDALRQRLDAIRARMTGLRGERQALRWHQRGRRMRVDTLIDGCQQEQRHLQREVARLSVRPSPTPPRPTLERAQDPLAASEPTRRRPRQRDLGRAL